MLEDAVECLKAAGFTFSSDSHLPKHTSLKASAQKAHPISPATQATRTQMVISQLPFKVTMAVLAKESTGQHAKILIQLLFYPETYKAYVGALLITTRGKRFFCYTETPDEVSLMMDSQAVEMFPEGSLTLNSRTWRVLQICEGSYGSRMYY